MTWFLKRKHGCPLCHEKFKDVTYDKNFVVNLTYDPETINYDNMNELSAFKNGRLVQCMVCERKWYECADKYYKLIFLLDSRQLEIIFDWEKADNTWENNRGLQASSVFNAYQEHFKSCHSLPCKILLASGAWVDYCLLEESGIPPFRFLNEKKRIFYLDQVKELQHSDYALSPEIMKEQEETPEAAMGFAPVTLVDNANRFYTVKAFTYFFNTDGIAGSRLKFSGRFFGREAPNIVDSLYDSIHIVNVFNKNIP